jgi:hypothetical protein
MFNVLIVVMLKRMRIYVKKCLLACLAVVYVASALFWHAPPAKAANFSMQTGYYVGTGTAGRTITGIGFQPQLVLIKSSTSAGVAAFKTSAMPAANTAFLSGAADNTSTQLTLTADGFTLGTLAQLNSANVLYTWTAFTGSDCSATGNFCVGTYNGSGSATRTITTGFQPSIVIAKRSTAVGGHFRTASMAANRSEFFTTTAADTAGNYLRSFASTSFDVGVTDNASGGVYYYIAFKSGSPVTAEGTYTGDAVDNRNITGVGFQPDLVFVKNSTSATTNNRRTVMSSRQDFGDSVSFTGDAVANAVNMVQALQSDGFQLGSGVYTNESTMTHYWFAFAGASGPPAASGTFSMDLGTYTGTGAAQTISGLSFAPDLIIIKDNAANLAVFRTRMMSGGITAYLGSATADFATGITSLTSDGFTLGASTVTNTNGNTYQWQAFGNAYNPYTNSGAADFAIGSYYGNGIDNRDIVNMPFQADFVASKRNSTSAGVFRSSAQTGDLSGLFSSTAEAANMIQAINADGFEVGTNAAINTSGSLNRWFAFKEGSNFDVGSYSGNAINDRTISSPNFQPDLVWIKQSTAVAGVLRPGTLAGDASQFFLATANGAGRIKSFASNGFTIGTAAEVNTNGGVYRYIAWREPASGVLSTDIVDAGGVSVSNPSFTLSALSYLFECSESTGILGTTSQRIRISNMTANASWTTSIAATSGTTALWRNGGDTEQFDYNDVGGSPNGCSDGGDTDTKAGKLRIEPAAATLSPQSGCSNTNVTLGSDANFHQGITDAITLVSAASGAGTECYWDLTDITVRQYIPEGQSSDNYNVNLTITTVSS